MTRSAVRFQESSLQYLESFESSFLDNQSHETLKVFVVNNILGFSREIILALLAREILIFDLFVKELSQIQKWSKSSKYT